MKIAYSILLMVFAAIITSEVIGMYFLYDFKNTLENVIAQDSEQQNKIMVNRIDNYATARLIDVMNFANSNTFENVVDSSNIQFAKMKDPEQYITKTDMEWTSVPQNEITPFMKTLINSKESENLRKIVNSENAIFNGEVYSEVFITNAYGANVAETDKTSDYMQSDETWWQEARKNGVYIGGIEFDNSSKTISFAVASRMNDANGNFIGVIKAVVSTEQMISIIKNQAATYGVVPTEYELIDGNNQVLYSTDPNESQFSPNIEKEYIGKVGSLAGHFIYDDPDSGEKYLVTYSHSQNAKISPLFGWSFIAKYKYASILEPVTKLSNYMLTTIFTAMIVVSIAVFITTTRITRPIETIKKSMDDYMSGRVTEIKPQGSEELNILGQHFNQMISKISDSQKAVSKSESLYRELFELNPDPIRISSLDLITTEVNQSFLDKFGYTREEIIGKAIFENINEKSRAKIDKVLEDLRKGKHVENIEVAYHKKDGTEIPVLLSVSFRLDPNGSPAGYIAVIKDISEIHNARNRIQEDEEKILNQYLKLAQVDELKDQFASMISHELTTPLFPIKFQSEILMDQKVLGKLNKEQMNAVNDIHKNSILLEKLISDILDAQKLEQKGLRFSKTQIKIDEFMNKIENDSKPMVIEKSISFTNSTKDKITITSDPDRLTQVFANLIKNAIDFVPEKGGNVEIGARADENNVLFYVKDNGVGIPKEKQANLFKKFYQIDTSLKRKHRGSGLGLSICKGIVEGLGGKIWIESTESLGTIAYFTIPKGGAND